ncbi:MAG TPA: ATP phosphoribosyltransferase regulatory subunit [Candidatus Binatia bacterium]|nr:ATP phosphoribosyltransferase regulatory subunit [Candidatus Binatia bacterium]
MATHRWWLPEGMQEWLPPDSWRLEELRRELLDLYRARGYELVITPLVEHLDALLTGTGSDLEQQTFKLVDPAGGRLLGVRADMTPQAARIAARRYAGRRSVRLCYLGTVLRTRPDTLGAGRSPLQVGCELFGDARPAADLEVLRLMLETLRRAGVRRPHLDLGHVGIYRSLAGGLRLTADDEAALFDIVRRKSRPDLEQLAARQRRGRPLIEALAQLMDLNGDPGVIARARRALRGASPAVGEALARLDATARSLRREFRGLPIHVDLAELRGYRYQTGVVFAAFADGHGRELARGGRYDGVGREFGVPRPATGFSADLNELMRLGSEKTVPRQARQGRQGKA